MKAEDLYDFLPELVKADCGGLIKARTSYGDSWKLRGGVGAFMMLARKWDRIENQTKKQGYDVFKAIELDPSNTGILDDIRDLRRYLLLVEAEMKFRLGEDESGQTGTG